MPVAELRRVTRRYGEVEALRGIDLSPERGELLALLGPDGAGKTTAARILPGPALPRSGKAALFGHDPASREARMRRVFAGIGRIAQSREHVKMYG